MTGEPPWPSKLLAWNDDKTKALVRFFGTGHQRAWVLTKNVRPIDEKPDIKKRPQRWLQAVEEKKLYEKQLNQLKTTQKKVRSAMISSCNIHVMVGRGGREGSVNYVQGHNLL